MLVVWTNYNISHFIIATLIARRLRERGFDIIPFGFAYSNIRLIKNKRAIIVSSFEHDEVTLLSDTRKNIIAIVKLLNRRIDKPTKIGKLYVIPVPRRNLNGLEYITSINLYTPYTIPLDEYKSLNDRKQEVALVLPVIDKFPEFMLELSIPEIPLTGKYVDEKIREFKEKYRFEELYSYYVKKLKKNIIKQTDDYVMIYIDGEPLKKFSVLAEKLFSGRTVVLIGRNRYKYKVLIVSDKNIKIRNINSMNAYILGGSKRLSIILERRKDEKFSKILHVVESVLA